MWEEVVEKTGDVEAKVNLQSLFYVREIDFRYPKGYRSSAKKDKVNIYSEPCNKASKDKNKAKSYTPTFANQPQTQASKKNKHGHRGGQSATGVNAIKVTKKDKDKTKDLSHVKCYICK